jgi:glucokinase
MYSFASYSTALVEMRKERHGGNGRLCRSCDVAVATGFIGFTMFGHRRCGVIKLMCRFNPLIILCLGDWPGRHTGRNRPMQDWVIGIDLGATKIALGLIDPQNQVVARYRFPTAPLDGPEAAVERMGAGIERLREMAPAGARVTGVGICTPGPLDQDAGILIEPPNLTGWRNVPLRDMLAQRVGLPVRMEHDAKAAALGEFYYGAGRGSGSMVYIVVGTGVGSAMIIDGTLYHGMHNTAGEVGHITIDPNGEPCACGAVGCVETFAAGPSLARRYLSALAREGRRPAEEVTGETVTRLAGQGDALALAIMEQAGGALATAIGTLAMIANIDLYVVGSSVAKCGEILFDPTRRAIGRHCYPSVAEHVRVVCSELGDDAPILGCGWLARQAAAEAVPEPAG